MGATDKRPIAIQRDDSEHVLKRLSLERCSEPLGTIRIDEQTSSPWYSNYATRFSTGSTVPALRLLIQQSNCFIIVDRGSGLQAANQERDLIPRAAGRVGSNFGVGQIVAAEYTLIPEVIISDSGGTRGGGLAGVGGLFGSTGAALGAVAGNFSTNEAGTVLTVIDNRSSVQLAAADGYAKNTDLGGAGALSQSGATAGAGAYTGTPQGNVLLASFMDSYNKLVVSVRNHKAQTVKGGLGTGSAMLAQGTSKRIDGTRDPSSQTETGSINPKAPATPYRTLNPYVNFDAPAAVKAAQHFAVQLWFSPREETKGTSIKPAAGQALIGEGRLGIKLLPGESQIRIKATLIAVGFDFSSSGSNTAELILNGDETSDPVRFDLVARVGDPMTRRLEVTLWRGGSFLGSVAREIEVEAPASGAGIARPQPGLLARSKSLGSVELSPLVKSPEIEAQVENRRSADREVQKTISVSSGQPLVADIILRVQQDDPRKLGGANVQIGSPYLSGMVDYSRWTFPPDSEEWLGYQIERIDRLRDTRNDKELNENIAAVRGIGELLYERLAPEPFKRVLAEVIRTKNTGDNISIQIYSDNPTIPWEIMRPGRIAGRDIDFLGMAFRVARWPVKVGERMAEIPMQDMPMKELVVIAPRYTGNQLLNGQAEEVSFLEKLRGFRTSGGTFESLRVLAQKPPVGIVHFAGHGETTGATPAQRRHFLTLEDKRLESTEWSGMFDSTTGASTLYFLNACELGSSESQVGSASGWAQAVLRRGAGGFVGGQWALRDRAASSFAIRFYDAFVNNPSGFNVAEALRRARGGFYKTGDSTDLAYVYYGDVNLEIAMPR